MKYKKEIIWAVVAFLILTINLPTITMAQGNGFSTELLSESEGKDLLENLNFSIFKKRISPQAIECFDVNENGFIAIGSSDSEKKTIEICDMNGFFQYGYRFEANGSFGLEWISDNLVIYIMRDSVAIGVTANGEVEYIAEIEDTVENNSYWNKSVFQTKKTVGTKTYIMKNDMGIFNIFASSYAQLISINEVGEISVIRDVNSMQIAKYFGMTIGIILFIVMVVFYIVKEFMKLNQKNPNIRF